MTLNRRLTDLSQERTGSRSRFTLFTEHRLGRGGEAEKSRCQGPDWPPRSIQPGQNGRRMFGTLQPPRATQLWLDSRFGGTGLPQIQETRCSRPPPSNHRFIASSRRRWSVCPEASGGNLTMSRFFSTSNLAGSLSFQGSDGRM